MTTAPATGAELADVVGEHGIDESAQAAIKAYVDKQLAANGELIRNEMQAGLAQFVKDKEAEGARLDMRSTTAVPTNAAAPGAAGNGKFANLGEMVATIGQAHKLNDHAAQARMGEYRNSLGTTIPSEGGYLVPEEFRAEMLRVGLETAVVRPKARVIPMANPRISWPTLEDTDRSSSLFGGVLAYWTAEGAALQASQPKFGKISLDTEKLTAYTEIPNELLTDSAISIGPLVDQLFPEALSWAEDGAFIDGSGVGMPLGWLNASCAVTVAAEGGQTADTVVWANVVKMYSQMLPTSLGRAEWYINQTVLPTLLQMTLPGGLSPFGMINSGQGSPTMTMLGRPINVTEKLPVVGDVGDIVFADLSYYLIGDYAAMTAMTSEHFRFNTDTIAYRVIERVDGRPWLQNSITPKKGSALSPIVKLAAR